jgi:hypothetical protein
LENETEASTLTSKSVKVELTPEFLIPHRKIARILRQDETSCKSVDVISPQAQMRGMIAGEGQERKTA